MTDERIAVITGASSGIGAAVATEVASAGFRVVLGARRADDLAASAAASGGVAHALDVTDLASIDAFARFVGERFGRVDVLVNNAGLALGREPIADSLDDDWVRMYETNVLGIARVTRAFMPLLRAAPQAHIVNVGSVAGFDVYPGGAGYTASKHAVRAITNTLRLELNGEPIRVTEVAPGMTETDFSLTRHRGDKERAAATYAGLTPLSAADVAACITFAVTRPPHVNVDYLVVRPTAQASSYLVARKALTPAGG
ncbi:MAG: SDR family NAD(P)-dependent oxidoreductase [Candidatus Velthaea sp.]